MVSVIRTHVKFAAKADDDALLRPGELLTHEAAAEFKLSAERIRQLCRRHGCGEWSDRLRAYVVNRVKLADHLARTRRKQISRAESS
jgi:hypothetical protein